MCKSRKIRRGRDILSVIAAVLSALLLLPSVLLTTFYLTFRDSEALSASLVTEEYLAAAEASAREVLIDQALLYGVEEDVLLQALAAQQQELYAVALSGTNSLIRSFFGQESYAPAPLSPQVFEDTIRTHLHALAEEAGDVAVQEEAVSEFAKETAELVSLSYAPVSGSTLVSAVESMQGIVPRVLWEKMPLFCTGAIVLLLALLVAAWFLAEKKRRLFTVSSALFCSGTLLFVPAYFLIPSDLFSSLSLSQGVLLEFLGTFYERLLFSVRLGALCPFVFSTLALLGSIFALCFVNRDDSVSGTEASVAADGKAELLSVRTQDETDEEAPRSPEETERP